MNSEFFDALRQVEREKDIPYDVLIGALEQALVHAYKKNYGVDSDVNVHVDIGRTGFRVFCEKQIVEEIENEQTQVLLEEARKIDKDLRLGESVKVEVTPQDFGRIAAMTAKHVLRQRIREVERDQQYERYNDMVGDVVTGVISRREGKSFVVNIGRIEALMPPSEQVPSESYKFNERLKVYILEARKTPRGTQVLVSRTHPRIVKRLFELEVPEIGEGHVQIKSIAREPGVRTKIAVHATDSKIDPVGSCVGPRGTRVQAVVDELFGEKVDIIRWSEDPKKFVAEALAPAAVEHVEIHEADHSAFVTARDDQLSLAIGKAGQNVRLAARLTGWKIDIRSESQVAAGDVPGAKQVASRPNGSSPYDEEYDELAQEKEAVKGLDDVEQAFLSEESLEEATS